MIKKLGIVVLIASICILGAPYIDDLVGFGLSQLEDATGDSSEYSEVVEGLYIDLEEAYDSASSNYYEIVEFEGRTGYYYDLLTEEEQQLYGELVTAYTNHEEEFDLSVYYSDMESDAVHNVQWYVLLDYPEFFWLSGENSITYVDIDEGRVLKTLTVTNTYTEEEILYYEELLEGIVEEVSALVSLTANEYEAALAVYEYIILNCEYDLESAEIKLSGAESTVASVESSTIVGCLIKGSAVCSGYSEAYTYLLNKIGINCFSVIGLAEEVGHEWNIIELDGEYYCVDSTWGDPDMEGKEDDDITYYYFGLTTEQLSATHTEMEGITYPECTAVEYNYFVYNGWCYDVYEYDTIRALFEKAVNENVEEVSFSFSSQEVYEQALVQLVETDLGKILGVYSAKLADGCGYIAIDELQVVSVTLKYK